MFHNVCSEICNPGFIFPLPPKNNGQKTSLPPKSQIGEFQNVKGPLIMKVSPFLRVKLLDV